ncbi:MAG: hypothetical protein CM15mP120_26130 [Pseudomonadota bacterium]|nr:MAG: hypothetical protein CM15mP120_26130 [Pseudomonadota bacterium]
MDYDIEQIQVGSRRFYILFSGRYPTKALAAQAATQMPWPAVKNRTYALWRPSQPCVWTDRSITLNPLPY